MLLRFKVLRVVGPELAKALSRLCDPLGGSSFLPMLFGVGGRARGAVDL
jgi:hypothetical protein